MDADATTPLPPTAPQTPAQADSLPGAAAARAWPLDTPLHARRSTEAPAHANAPAGPAAAADELAVPLPAWSQEPVATRSLRAPGRPSRGLLSALLALLWPRRGAAPAAQASAWPAFGATSRQPGTHPPLDGETQLVAPPPPPLPGMMAMLDLQQRCMAASPGLARWLGTDRDRLHGLPLEQMLGSAAAAVLGPQVEAALAGHLRRLRCCHVAASGAERWLQVELQPQVDEYGERVGCHLLAMDVTPEHRQWQSTQRSERRLRFMLDQVPATVAYIDTDMRFRHVNRAQARWLGVADGEATGVPVQQLVDASTWAELQPDLATALGGVALPSHRQLLDAAGEATWQTGTHVPDVHSDGRVLGVVSVFVDQPELNAPALPTVSAGATDGATAAPGQPAPSADGHPTGGAQGLAHGNATSNATKGSSKHAELVLDLHADSPLRPWLVAQRGPGASVLSVMNDALDLVRLSAGQVHAEQLDFHLQAAVEDVVQLLAPRAHAQQLELACRIDPLLPEGLRGDPQRLHQVLVHLLDNAVKHTLGGEVLLEVQRQGDEQLRFAVRDTGIGLSAEQQQRLAALLASDQPVAASAEPGSGLGLAVVRALVRLMGGQLGVHSQPGEGATFWFTLPLVPAEGLPPLPRPAPLPAHHVLVVDDNATSRAILQQHLVAGGQRCSTAANAGEALALLHTAQQAGDPVRVALVDVRMPGTDGISLAAQVRADSTLAGTQLVLMTGQQSRQDLARARQAGVAAYLCKPVRGPDLYRALSQALSQSLSQALLPSPLAALEPRVLADAPAPQAAEPSQATPTADAPPASPADALPVLHARVLVAEDNSVHQAAARDMLKALGCDFEVVADGAEALQALRVEHFDLVLMDCVLPGLDGLAATRAIRQREQASHTRRRQAVIGLDQAEPAAGEPPHDRAACQAAGMDEVLTKPFTRRQLADAMARWLPPQLVEHPTGQPGMAGALGAIGAIDAIDAKGATGHAQRLTPSGPVRLSAVPSRHAGFADCLPDPQLLNPQVLDQHPSACGQAPGGGTDPLARNQVIRDFVNSLPALLQAMRRALLDSQPEALARAASQLARASSSVGAGTLAELCWRLDALGQAQQLAGATELVAAVESVIDRLLPVLQAEVRMAA